MVRLSADNLSIVIASISEAIHFCKYKMLDINYAESLFNFLYSDIKGYDVSKNARINFAGDTSNLLYGELPFQTCKELFLQVNPKSDGVFFDLGSGTGRVVMQALLATNFKKMVGIELLDGLHDKAVEVKKIFDDNIKDKIFDHVKDREFQLIKADLFKQDYSQADFIFMNHPIKDCDLFLKLEEKLFNELRPGAKVATIIRAFKNPGFKSLGSKAYEFSWGQSTAHFFER